MSRKSKWILHEANNYDYILLSIIQQLIPLNSITYNYTLSFRIEY